MRDLLVDLLQIRFVVFSVLRLEPRPFDLQSKDVIAPVAHVDKPLGIGPARVRLGIAAGVDAVQDELPAGLVHESLAVHGDFREVQRLGTGAKPADPDLASSP